MKQMQSRDASDRPTRSVVSAPVQALPNAAEADQASEDAGSQQDRADARHLAAIVTSSSDAIISVGLDLVVRSWNPAATRLFGYAASEALGQPIHELILEDGRRSEGVKLYQAVVSGQTSFVSEARCRRNDGGSVMVELSVSPIRNERTAIAAISLIARDIRDRRMREAALERGRDTYLSLIEQNPFGVYLIDADFRMVQLSIGATPAFVGIKPLLGRDFAEILREQWPDPFASEVIGHFRHTLATGEAYHARDTREVRQDTATEESYDWKIERVTLPDGRFGVVCYFYDMTERARYEEHIRMLMNEVNHRAKNLLGVVQAVARQTARAGDPTSFVDRLSDRIAGLTASHDLLVRNEWRGVETADLVRDQLAHFEDLIGARVIFDGPPACLKPTAAQGIGMALHELATNAGKYGALSNSQGVIRIHWTVGDGPDGDFTMTWSEADGPVVTPPAKPGFGETVIVRMAEYAVEGRVSLDYRAAGVLWQLTAPIQNVLEPKST